MRTATKAKIIGPLILVGALVIGLQSLEFANKKPRDRDLEKIRIIVTFEPADSKTDPVVANATINVNGTDVFKNHEIDYTPWIREFPIPPGASVSTQVTQANAHWLECKVYRKPSRTAAWLWVAADKRYGPGAVRCMSGAK